MKKENMFNYVVSLIEHGHWVAVETHDGRWRVFMYVNGGGSIEGTYITSSIEKCLKYGLDNTYFCKEAFEKYFTTNYKILPQKPQPLKVGDRVEVLSIYDNEEFKGHKFDITEVHDDDCYGVYYRDNEGYTFPHYALAPVMEEEVEEMTMEEVCKALGKTIKIKK